jgi:hypothetical protein
MAMVLARSPGTRVSSWLLVRKLRRRTTEEVAAALAGGLIVRALAAACAFCSMALIAWLAAFAREVFRHGLTGFRTLSAAGLSHATAQAGRYEAGLIPVLAVWAALLLFAPAGYAIAFRAAALAAAVLGALDLSPPSFRVTPWTAGFARGLVQLSRSWSGVLLLVASLAAAFLLYRGALGVFERLGQFSAGRLRRPAPVTRFLLALVVLLSAAWTGTVVWLAASHAHGDATSYGSRGGLVQGDYLLALAIAALLVAGSGSTQGRLLVVTPLAALLGAFASDLPVPHELVWSAGRADLERAGAWWGGGSLWAALFVGFPLCLLGIYLVARVRRRRVY